MPFEVFLLGRIELASFGWDATIKYDTKDYLLLVFLVLANFHFAGS